MLEKISGFTVDEAKNYLIENVREDVTHEMALTVKEVDENGLPTEYEAVYPQFIGYERLFELTTTEAISSVSAALENPGYFSDLLIVAKIKESSGTHGIYYGGASNPILKLGKLVSDSKMMVVAMVAEICETHSGELEDPIPYSGNMALEKGKYYFENNGIYLCIRDTINPVYHKLSELIGLYVEEV